MVQSFNRDWFQIVSDLKPNHPFCWCYNSFAFSFDGWGRAVCQPSQWSIEVESTDSTMRKQYPRTIPPFCCHCYEWKPNFFYIKSLCGRRYWRKKGGQPLLCVLGVWGMMTIVVSFQWLCVVLIFEDWPVPAPSAGVRYRPQANHPTLKSSISLKLNSIYLNLNGNHKSLTSLIASVVQFKTITVQLHLLLFFSGFCLAGPEASMASKEGNKPKKSYKNTLLNQSDPVSSNKTKQTGSASHQKPSSSEEEAHLSGNKEACSRTAKHSKKQEKGDSSYPQGKMDVASFLKKLTKVKENFQTLQESSLFGFLIGKFHDFKKKTNKLKFDWKNMNGSVEFIDRQMGWFEVRFSNPIDKKQVWDGRPYHIFSQLLLLKPWSPTFDPVSESIFMVDMWVRILSLPPEYYNFESINTILEFNNVGSLLKLDPNASRRNWAKFARFCINLDCSKSISKEIVIPDEFGNMKKFTLWFEDIPHGCGNCGELDHSFNSCPLRKFITPKFKITFKKPLSSSNSAQDPTSVECGWNPVSKKGKEKTENSNNVKKGKEKISEEFGGIGVIYITDESSTESKSDQIAGKEKVNSLKNDHSAVSSGPILVDPIVGVDDPSVDPVTMMDPNAFSLPTTIPQDEVVANQHYIEEINKERVLAEAEDNMFYYHEEENEEWAEDGSAFLFEEHPSFEGTLGENLNNVPLPEFPLEETSFHSMNSDNSMLHLLADIEIKKTGLSSSSSGKRKSSRVEGDTASSEMVGHKRPKI